MKRNELLGIILCKDAVFIRHGGNHDIYENPRTHKFTSIPRHTNINEHTALDIIKKMSM